MWVRHSLEMKGKCHLITLWIRNYIPTLITGWCDRMKKINGVTKVERKNRSENGIKSRQIIIVNLKERYST